MPRITIRCRERADSPSNSPTTLFLEAARTGLRRSDFGGPGMPHRARRQGHLSGFHPLPPGCALHVSSLGNLRVGPSPSKTHFPRNRLRRHIMGGKTIRSWGNEILTSTEEAASSDPPRRAFAEPARSHTYLALGRFLRRDISLRIDLRDFWRFRYSGVLRF